MKRFTTSDGLGLAFRDDGAGLPVLCLPGLTRNSRDFEPLLAALGPGALDGLRLVRLDPRGRGASDHDPVYTNYNVLIEARDALELLDHLGIARAAVIGTSRGGILAMVIAAHARDRLLGVVLNDVGPVLEAEGLARIAGYLGVPPSVPTLDAAAAIAASLNAREFPGLDAAAWRVHLDRILVETPEGLGLRYDPALRTAFLEASDAGAPTPDMWPLYDALAGLPVALLRGANSDLLSEASAAAMQARHPGLIYAVVPDRGHVPFLDEPESLAAIRALLAQVQEDA